MDDMDDDMRALLARIDAIDASTAEMEAQNFEMQAERFAPTYNRQE